VLPDVRRVEEAGDRFVGFLAAEDHLGGIGDHPDCHRRCEEVIGPKRERVGKFEPMKTGQDGTKKGWRIALLRHQPKFCQRFRLVDNRTAREEEQGRKFHFADVNGHLLAEDVVEELEKQSGT